MPPGSAIPPVLLVLEMAWIRWTFLLCALLSPLLEASEKGRLRTITYVLRPNQSMGISSSRRQQQQQQRTFNVELKTGYSSSSLERTRRMSQGSLPSVQLRLGPTVQLQHKPGKQLPPRSRLQQRSSNATSSLQAQPKPRLQQLQG